MQLLDGVHNVLVGEGGEDDVDYLRKAEALLSADVEAGDVLPLDEGL